MKKYRVIKEFPNDIQNYKVGMIISTDGFSDMCEQADKFPEFFEEIKWEILEFIGYNGKITSLRSNGYYVYQDCEPEGCPDGKGETLDNMLNSELYDDCTIYKVKRVSDGEVFTVGENVKCDIFKYRILGFSIEYGNIFAEFEDEDFEVEGGYANNYLDSIEKLPTPLFTTYDNFDVFIGDPYWVVDTNYLNHCDGLCKVNEATQTHTGDGVGRVYFSNKTSANKYMDNIRKYTKYDMIRFAKEALAQKVDLEALLKDFK